MLTGSDCHLTMYAATSIAARAYNNALESSGAMECVRGGKAETDVLSPHKRYMYPLEGRDAACHPIV